MSSRNYSSSDLTKRINARILYADYLVQTEQFRNGLTSRVQLTGGSAGTNPSSSLIPIEQGATYTSLEEQNAILTQNIPPPPPEVVRLGLALYYNLGISASYPGSGTSIFDLSPNGYTGTLVNGPTYSSANGGSLIFDGTNDYINTSQSLATEDFTQLAWVKTTDVTNYRMIFSKEVNAGTPWNYRLYYQITSGELVMDVANPTQKLCTYSGVNLADGQWHFVCGSRNSTTGIFKLYVDGNLVKTQADGITGAISQSQTLWIGRSIFSGGSYAWKGNIGATLLYTRALTDSEVLQNFNATKSRFL